MVNQIQLLENISKGQDFIKQDGLLNKTKLKKSFSIISQVSQHFLPFLNFELKKHLKLDSPTMYQTYQLGYPFISYRLLVFTKLVFKHVLILYMLLNKIKCIQIARHSLANAVHLILPQTQMPDIITSQVLQNPPQILGPRQGVDDAVPRRVMQRQQPRVQPVVENESTAGHAALRQQRLLG